MSKKRKRGERIERRGKWKEGWKIGGSSRIEYGFVKLEEDVKIKIGKERR